MLVAIVDGGEELAVKAVGEARRIEVEYVSTAPAPHLLEPHAPHRRGSRDGLALAKDGRDAGALHPAEVHPLLVVALLLRAVNRVNEPLVHVALGGARHLDQLEEGGPRIDGEHLGHVAAHLRAKPWRGVATEGVEPTSGHLGEAREETILEGQKAARDATPLPAPLQPLLHRAAIGGRQAWVIAASPEHAAVERLAEERPGELGPAHTGRDGKQRHEHADARLRSLSPCSLIFDEALQTSGHLHAHRRVALRQGEHQPVDLAEAVEQSVRGRHALICKEDDDGAEQLREDVKSELRHTAR
mmetsp:Transcript_79915/g.158836  ORF Transcript_79915/g.158836 Transcript_79915/m.158836 type:complete len:301 (+) Transcript_79915:271-1173(+)